MSAKTRKAARKRARTRRERTGRREQAERMRAQEKQRRDRARAREEDESFRADLARPRKPRVEDIIGRPGKGLSLRRGSYAQLHRLATVVLERCPRLAEPPYVNDLKELVHHPWRRPLEDWRPRGRGARTALRSLIEHLFVRYAVPQFLFDALMSGELHDRRHFMPVFLHLADGGSPRALVGTSVLPAPLTRRMCHILLTTPGPSDIVPAVRRAQMLARGGEERLLRAVQQSRLGRAFDDEEPFWDTVLAWLCRQPELDPAEIEPLLDYLSDRRKEDRRFAMKGRTPAALRRAQREWHRRLASERVHGHACGPSFDSCGADPGIWCHVQKQQGGGRREVIWTMNEILDYHELISEGRAMRHCVASYAWLIRDGRSSIWSLCCNEERRLTVEVSLRQKAVVQVRGRYNRLPRRIEVNFLCRWARANGLRIMAYALDDD